MTDMRINWAFMTLTFLGSMHPQQLPYLRHVCIAGEAPGVSQVNTWAPLIRTIGVPVHRRAWLVDPGDPLNLAPVGVPGELVITGPGLANGYFADEERPRRSFLSGLPWLRQRKDTDGSTNVYTTGDITRYNEDGSFAYVERKDHQVKIPGMRVELGEVEASCWDIYRV
ncbi:hypothetical protein BJX76DRAFT_358048 [Aspergillus varians]